MEGKETLERLVVLVSDLNMTLDEAFRRWTLDTDGDGAAAVSYLGITLWCSETDPAWDEDDRWIVDQCVVEAFRSVSEGMRLQVESLETRLAERKATNVQRDDEDHDP